MNVLFGLLRLVRKLSSDRSERRRLASAVVLLLRHRRFSLAVVGPLLRIVPNSGTSKLRLWQCLASSLVDARQTFDNPDALGELKVAIGSTQAFADVVTALTRDRNGYLQRGLNYPQLRRLWIEHPPERMLVFHHYDRRGFLPKSWQDALLVLQASGWQVVLSTSHIDESTSSTLELAGVQIARRLNIGLCLGAYRDLALLLHSTPAAHRKLKSLVLCNDSNLLVHSPEALVAQLNRWTSCSSGEFSNEYPMPILAGLTDSVERESYHIQSYFLYANQELLQHSAWLRFWLNYSIDGSKDDSINQGEIGLSQSLLSVGVSLMPAFPLVQGLLTDPDFAEELQIYAISRPEQINQSLFAWRSLLARGFPFVKKHVLFQLSEDLGQPMAISELARLIPDERRDLLARDIEQLLISRYIGGAPRMS